MTHCRPQRAADARSAANALAVHPTVEGEVAVIEPDAGPTSAWVLELVVAVDSIGAVPHSLERAWLARGYQLYRASDQGPDYKHVLLVARAES